MIQAKFLTNHVTGKNKSDSILDLFVLLETLCSIAFAVSYPLKGYCLLHKSLTVVIKPIFCDCILKIPSLFPNFIVDVFRYWIGLNADFVKGTINHIHYIFRKDFKNKENWKQTYKMCISRNPASHALVLT